ncbi:unnamed protein product [Microthlaspi erraticum]|uniref:RRM domain-containing protein n=1 Tax=Microthlaspi erraticum TaxID=1685480 RepID=A0A6D2IXT2_9BRAS|nr:unnamed protein product [Microthlaspi erraticum]
MEGGGSGGGVRLHVGGLGESVGRDDLLKIFSPMGSVDAVEFVRTKGRSFAYIDFSPSSENSLTKLFSTYNGCVWKGGKLRLEKAKEHYLARLKREWEASSSSPSDVTIKAPDDSTPTTHLNIFFPRLRKVKPMPLSGTGKHKYSFQRVLVPSLLPKTFCDCEEHSTSLTPRETHVRDLEALNVGVGINDEEVNIMNSVMNKLLGKDNKQHFEKDKQLSENDSELSEDDNELLEDDNELLEDDNELLENDNIIINVASNGKDMMDSELDILSRKRKSILNETPASGAGYTEEREGNNIHPSKKRQTIIPEGNGKQEPSQAIREKKKPSEVVPDKSIRTTGVKQSNDNISWSQKSSWKALVAGGNSSSFSVSSFLPGFSSSEAVQPASGNTDLEGLDVPTETTKIKKMKSKRQTSTIMAGNLPVADDSERNDATDTDAVDSDHSEDSDTDESVEAEAMELVPGTEVDSENDSERNDATETDAEDSDHSGDTDTDKSVEAEPMEFVPSTEVDSEDDSERNEATETDAVDSDHSEDTDTEKSVEAEAMELEPSTEVDSENDNLNVEKDEDVAEDLDAEEEGSVLKDDVDEEKKGEKTGKGPLEACSKSTGGSSWLQRGSWTQLVSDKSASFSITQLFPDLASDKKEVGKVDNNGDGQLSISNQSESGMKQRDYACSSTNGFEAAGVHVDSTPVRSLAEKRQGVKGKNASEGCRLVPKKPFFSGIGSGEACTFKRSETSLKEWAKAKRALSEPRRTKKTEE